MNDNNEKSIITKLKDLWNQFNWWQKVLVALAIVSFVIFVPPIIVVLLVLLFAASIWMKIK